MGHAQRIGRIDPGLRLTAFERGQAIAGPDRGCCAGRWSGRDLGTIGTPMVHGAIRIDSDGDVVAMDQRMVVPAFGHEVLDVVVTAEGTVMTVVHLHDRGGAARPGTGVEPGMHRAALLWGDCGGAAAEMQRIAGIGVDDREQAGVAGEPTGGVAFDARTRWLEDVAGGRPAICALFVGVSAGLSGGLTARVQASLFGGVRVGLFGGLLGGVPVELVIGMFGGSHLPAALPAALPAVGVHRGVDERGDRNVHDHLCREA